MEPLIETLGAPAVRHASACIDVPGGRVEISYYNERPPGYCAQPATNYAVRADGNDMPPGFVGGSPFPADPAQPQVSGKLGDGKLLQRGKNLVKLLIELGLIKPIPLPM